MVVVKLPGNWKIPFIGERVLVKHSYCEDELFPNQYELYLRTTLSSFWVRSVFEWLSKQKRGVEFKDNFEEGKTVVIPREFFEKTYMGVFSLEDALLKSVGKHQLAIHKSRGIIFETTHLESVELTKVNGANNISIKVIGKKRVSKLLK
jgi:hypothetical protein